MKVFESELRRQRGESQRYADSPPKEEKDRERFCPAEFLHLYGGGKSFVARLMCSAKRCNKIKAKFRSVCRCREKEREREWLRDKSGNKSDHDEGCGEHRRTSFRRCRSLRKKNNLPPRPLSGLSVLNILSARQSRKSRACLKRIARLSLTRTILKIFIYLNVDKSSLIRLRCAQTHLPDIT